MSRSVWVVAVVCCLANAANAGDVVIRAERPMPPPNWALLERELLRANAAACDDPRQSRLSMRASGE